MINILYLGEGSGFAGAESYFLNLVKGISAFDKTSVSCGLFYSGPLKDKLQEKHIRVLQLFGRHNFRSALFLLRYVREHQINLVHLVDLKSTIVWGIASLFTRDVRVVATIHGIPESYDSFYMKIKYGVSLALYYLVLRLAVDRIICVSNDLSYRLRRRIGIRKVRVVHNGIDISSTGDTRQAHRSGKNSSIIGTVGRLDTVKGHAFLLESALLILDAGYDAIFQIIGDGPLDNVLKQQAKQLGIAGRVRFLGFRSDPKELMRSMDVFVLPSLHEGIPYALLEAMSLSKAVVCTSVGGLKEVIEDRVNGLLVPKEDTQALSHALMALLDNPDYASELGRRARRRIEEEFSLDQMAFETFSIYESLTFSTGSNTDDRG